MFDVVPDALNPNASVAVTYATDAPLTPAADVQMPSPLRRPPAPTDR
jgi:hypothetical protein